MVRGRMMGLAAAAATIFAVSAASAAGTNATVGDADASKTMANDPNNAIHAMDSSSRNNFSGNETVKIPDLGPSVSKGAGYSRTGGVPLGTTR